MHSNYDVFPAFCLSYLPGLVLSTRMWLLFLLAIISTRRNRERRGEELMGIASTWNSFILVKLTHCLRLYLLWLRKYGSRVKGRVNSQTKLLGSPNPHSSNSQLLWMKKRVAILLKEKITLQEVKYALLMYPIQYGPTMTINSPKY